MSCVFFIWNDAEHLFPCSETLQSFLSEFRKTCFCFLQTLFVIEMALGEELVSIADKFLFRCLRQEVVHGKGQMLYEYLFTSDACSGVAFADAGMSRETFCKQHPGSDVSMTDVRLAAETLYAGRIAAHDSDVVQHGSLFNEPSVKFQLRMLTGDGESLVGYGAAVDKEDVAQSIVFGIIFVYDCLIIHCLLLYRWSRGRTASLGTLYLSAVKAPATL